MSKYWLIFKTEWQLNLIYRLNFTLWRVRSVLQLLLIYFIWWTVFQFQAQVFGYTQVSILTYVLVAALIRAIVLSTRVTDLMDSINSGNVVNFLIKPLGFVRYYLVRDVADKLFNILFYIFELWLIILLLKPQIIFQTNILTLILFSISIIGGLVIYFYLNFIISLLTFWVESSWGPLFLMTIFLEGFGGGLFPIDILPKAFYNLLVLTPFPYLIYFPSKIYLGINNFSQVTYGFFVIGVWILILHTAMSWLIRAGLRQYTAVGN